MLFVLFNVVNDGARQLNFSQQIEVSKYKEDLLTLLKLIAGIILENEQVIFFCDILSDTSLAGSVGILNIEV